jgi:hypothetical protein
VKDSVFTLNDESPTNYVSHIQDIGTNSGKDYWLVASHSDKVINSRVYTPAELQRLGESYVKPYNKPVLKNHDTDSEPVGRIVDFRYIPQGRWSEAKDLLGEDIELPIDSSGALLLKAHITDPEAIQKIEDSRYMTVSIGFSASSLKCSICGQDWVSEGPCEHEFGHMYDGQLAVGIPSGMQAMEISFVNVPADDYARVANSADDDKYSADTYVFVKKRSKSTVLFTDNVNLGIATCGVTSHEKDHEESEAKDEMAKAKEEIEQEAKTDSNANSNATSAVITAEDVSKLSDELSAIKGIMSRLIRLQITNFNAVSERTSEGIDEETDLSKLMDELVKAVEEADKVISSSCDECDSNEEEEKQDNAEDEEKADSNVEAESAMFDSITELSKAINAMREDITHGFDSLKEYMGTLVDKKAEAEVTDSADNKEEVKPEEATEANDSENTKVVKEVNPVAVTATDSDTQPKTLKELFLRTFKA